MRNDLLKVLAVICGGDGVNELAPDPFSDSIPTESGREK